MRNTKLLVVIDESQASKRAVSYVAGIIGGRRGFKVCLAHTLPEIPPHLTEHGGAEDPSEEEKLERELHSDQNQWLVAAKKKAQPVLAGARAVLRKVGLTASSIEERYFEPAEGRARGGEILELASERRCDTIVVGSESLSRWRQLLGNDPVEELLRRGKGFTVWVVE